jgi:uncharacterized membrane protein YkoI
MFSFTKKTLLALAGTAAFAAGGATVAGAATTSTPSSPPPPSSSSPRGPGPPQTQLTGDTADKVKAAAQAKVPGGTVVRVEDGGPGGSGYHAHVRSADGKEVVVLVNSSFEATAVQTRPARARGGRDHGRGGPGGRGDHGREAALTGDTAAKVKAAAQAKVPGGTVLRVEDGGPGGSGYHAQVRSADGKEVVVLVNASFEATSVVEHPHP